MRTLRLRRQSGSISWCRAEIGISGQLGEGPNFKRNHAENLNAEIWSVRYSSIKALAKTSTVTLQYMCRVVLVLFITRCEETSTSTRVKAIEHLHHHRTIYRTFYRSWTSRAVLFILLQDQPRIYHFLRRAQLTEFLLLNLNELHRIEKMCSICWSIYEIGVVDRTILKNDPISKGWWNSNGGHPLLFMFFYYGSWGYMTIKISKSYLKKSKRIRRDPPLPIFAITVFVW